MKKQKKQKNLKEGGITLVALVITIIILLILAGVTINIAIRENGLFNISRVGVDEYKKSATNEQKSLDRVTEEIANIVGSGDSGTGQGGGAVGSLEIDGQTIKIEKGKVEIENHKQLEVVEEELNENLEKYLLELKKYFYSLKHKDIKKTLEEFTTTEEISRKRSLKK